VPQRHHGPGLRRGHSAPNAASRVDYETAAALNCGKTGAEAPARNLTTLLQLTPEELVRYGVNVQGVDATIVNFAKTLITFKKSVERNLTGSVVVQAAPGDDPHDADPAGGGTRQHKLTWTALATVWKQFTTDMLAAKMDFLATIAGDTTKSVTSSSGWPDGLSQNGDLSMMFVLDTTGHVKPGIFGSYGPGVVNRAISFNAATGAPDPTTPADPAATAALSACVSAIVRKDSNLPAGIALGNVRGLTRPRIDGPTPDQHRGITGG
jgi:hypothetical protein